MKEEKQIPMANEEYMLLRYTAPTKTCLYAYGQIWKHIKDEDAYRLWIQAGKDEVNWLPMGEFLEQAFAHEMESPKFMMHCLDLYRENTKSDSN